MVSRIRPELLIRGEKFAAEPMPNCTNWVRRPKNYHPPVMWKCSALVVPGGGGTTSIGAPTPAALSWSILAWLPTSHLASRPAWLAALCNKVMLYAVASEPLKKFASTHVPLPLLWQLFAPEWATVGGYASVICQAGKESSEERILERVCNLPAIVGLTMQGPP